LALNFTTFPRLDFGRFLVCYSSHPVVPKTVEKPFLAIFSGFNPILIRLQLQNNIMLSHHNQKKFLGNLHSSDSLIIRTKDKIHPISSLNLLSYSSAFNNF